MKLTKTILLSTLLIGSSSVALASEMVEGDDANPGPMRKMGFKRSDPEDLKAFAKKGLLARRPIPVSLPKSWDLTKYAPEAYDQGDLGSCTANAQGVAFVTDQNIQYMFNGKKTPDDARLRKALAKDHNLSRLFIYYEARRKEQTKGQNSVLEDNGAYIRSGVEVLYEKGAPLERDYGYDISKFAEKPPKAAYRLARENRDLDGLGKDYIAPQGNTYNLDEMKLALVNFQVLIFGADLFPGFQSAETEKTGIVPMPKPGQKSIGGHAMAFFGYDDAMGAFIVRNSWGPGWGLKGNCYLPYAYVNPTWVSEVWKLGKVTMPNIPLRLEGPTLEVPRIVENNNNNNNNNDNNAATGGATEDKKE